MLKVVITTIQQPTECMLRFSDKLQSMHVGFVVAGDTKGPESYDLPNTTFLDMESQRLSGFTIAEKLPVKHYARKNMGYLRAIQDGATCIYETDDDNRPADHWNLRQQTVEGSSSPSEEGGWVNVYKYFTDALIWPRGLPLDQIQQPLPALERNEGSMASPIQQGLVNNAADVDAIWRLTMDRPFYFDEQKQTSVYLKPGSWSPFNTQSTWWWPMAYPLLYIPSYCSFRMCDIWKSFIAQRCLWAMDLGVTFHAPEVIQDRNVHDLNKDFEDEVPGYLYNERIREVLESLSLKPGEDGVISNLYSCYEALVKHEIFPTDELPLVEAWCNDLRRLGVGS
ncbi:STELLO glycosyltransferase family protein [Kiritimatiellota bacterium B12222]|nr:STELLO glycosyltransferase family protein [Kiritimatiellota bacterium B12222]